jgi:hypothetical protein
MMKQILKAMFVGCEASLVMLVLVLQAIQHGWAPFNLPPSAAFLARLGRDQVPYPLVLHFGYGAFWSVFLVLLFRERTSFIKGLGLGLALWLLLMIVYAPLLDWGLFGRLTPAGLSPQAPLYHVPGTAFVLTTLAAHLVYGGLVGWLNPLWVEFQPSSRPLETRSAEL